MKPARFAYHAPSTLEDALSLLAEHGDEARILAGGQSLVPAMNLRLARPAHLLDINGVAGLSGIAEDGGRLAIGALTRHAEIETSELVGRRCPILAEAARHIGHYAIRQRGTIGGSLCHADPAAEWPLMAILLDAVIEVAGPGAGRNVAARDFIQSVYTTDLAEDEILTRVLVPLPGAAEGWGYRQMSRRAGDFAIAMAAATLRLEAGRVAALRLALGGIAEAPLRLDDIERDSLGAEPDAVWIRGVADATADGIEPGGDLHADAAYRSDLVRTLLAQAIQDALDRARGAA
jgi:carbon-monoxide dehydrogenase medium subunit